MDHLYLGPTYPLHDPETARELFAIGAWFQGMVVSGGIAVAATIEAVAGNGHRSSAALIAVGGAMLAVFAFRRFWKSLGEAGDDTSYDFAPRHHALEAY